MCRKLIHGLKFENSEVRVFFEDGSIFLVMVKFKNVKCFLVCGILLLFQMGFSLIYLRIVMDCWNKDVDLMILRLFYHHSNFF